MKSMSESETPLFSVILAFRNEAAFLEDCLNSFDQQSLSKDMWEIILIDGCSNDGSRLIAERYVRNHSNSKLIDNPDKIATSGWNKGIEAASGKYFCLTSGHSITDKHFLSRAKEILDENEEIYALGGRIFKVGINNLSKSIAAATNIPFAMGGSYYRIGEKAKRVNSVGFGIYLKKLVDLVGFFDESVERSGDWEFNYRVYTSGFYMYFDPEIRVKVSTRTDYKSIFIQQFRTGFWKIKVWAKQPGSILPRHVIPSIFVLWLISIPLILFLKKALLNIWLFPLLLYMIALAISTIKAVRNENVKWYFVVLTFPIIHVAYGLGFITGLFRWWKFLVRGLIKSR